MKKLSTLIFMLVVLLIIFGLLPMMSASYSFSNKIYGDSFYMLSKQALFAGIGVFILILFAVTPYQTFKKVSIYFLIVSIIAVFALFFYAVEIKGAKRSLPLWGFSIQPIEFARLAFILHISAMLAKQGELINDFKKGLVYPIFWMVLTAVIIYRLPNVSNGLMFIVIGLGLLFISKLRFAKFLLTSGLFILTGIAGAFATTHGRGRLLDYYARYFSDKAPGFQIRQSMIGIGSGGMFGLGAGNSNMSNLFLPEAWGDFIFSIIGEEWGFIFSSAIVFVYFIMFIIGMKVAKDCKDLFGKYLAFGISFSFILYAFVNILVATGKLPTTGLPLPFISQGGASMISMCMAFGLLISIARFNERGNAETVAASEGDPE